MSSRGYLEINYLAPEQIERVHIGVRAKLEHSLYYNGIKRFNKGDNVLVQPLDKVNGAGYRKFRVTGYRDNKEAATDEQPESHRDIIIGDQIEGYLPEDKGLFAYQEHCVATNAPLFPAGSPSHEDIRQKSIPDCFLLAALQAILTHPNGAEYIKSMMRQTDHGTTIVRLYHPVKKCFVYKEVGNDVLANKMNRPLNSHKALWVHILEHAYASLGLRSAEEESADNSYASVYTDGGYSNFALQCLTGLNGDIHRLNHETTAMPWDLAAYLGPNFDILKVIIEYPSDARDNLPKVIRGMLYKKYDTFAHILGNELSAQTLSSLGGNKSNEMTAAMKKFIAYFEFYLANKDQVQLCIEQAESYDQVLPLLQQTFAESDIATEVFSGFRQSHYVKTSDAVGENWHQAFSGVYHQREIEAYADVQYALSQGKLVTATSLFKFEQPVAGLCSNHVYTVLGVTQRDIILDKSKTRSNQAKAYFVKLRNPWGTMGRVYDDKNIPLSDNNAPIFEIELKDFCRYFAGFTCSVSADNIFFSDKQVEQLRQYIKRSIQYNKEHIKVDSSIEELLHGLFDYYYCVEQQVKLQLSVMQRLDKDKVEQVYAIFASNSEDEYSQVCAILDEADITTIPQYNRHNPIEAKEHLFYLLKYHWLQQQQIVSKQALKQCSDMVIRQPLCRQTWLELQAEKHKLDAVILTRASSNMHAYTRLNSACIKLKTQLQLLAKAKSYDHAKACQLIAAMLKIKEDYQHVMMINKLTCQLNVGISDDDIEQLNKTIDQLDKKIKRIEQVGSFYQMAEDKMLEIVDATKALRQRHQINNEEAEQILESVRNFANQGSETKLAKMSDELMQRTNPDVVNLGREMGVFSQLLTNLKNAWRNVVDSLISFKNMAASLFVSEYNYRTEPDDRLERHLAAPAAA